MGNKKSNALPILIIIAAVLTVAGWKISRSPMGKTIAKNVKTFASRAKQSYDDGEARRAGMATSRDADRDEDGIKRISAPGDDYAPSAVAGNSAASPDYAIKEIPVSDKVRPCEISGAKWCVLTGVTPVKSVYGNKSLGNVKGGRFFEISYRTKIAREDVCVGNFTPKAMEEIVYVPQSAVKGFSGSVEDLPAEAAAKLREYYELEGEIKARTDKLQLEFSQRSPYTAEAVQSLRRLNELQKIAREKTFESTDEQRKTTYEISALQSRISELNIRHKEWKTAHASEAPNPDGDPVVKSLRETQNKIGLAVKSLVK